MRSPAANRTIQILDLLTTHPGRGFTLSELSRQLVMSKATAHRILTEFADHGLVVRDADTQEYRLGPALVPMGAVAERSFPALKYARREAKRLAEQHDAECVLLMPTGDELLVIGRTGVPGPVSFGTFEGQRHPLLPPLGTIFLAWKSEEALEEWLDGYGDQLSQDERQYYRKAVDAQRRRGYTIALEVPGLFDLYDLYTTGNPYTQPGRRKIREAYEALAHDHRYLAITEDVMPDARLSSIAAPVFGPDQSVLFTICLLLVGSERYRGRDAPALGRAVSRAANRVTTAIDGRRPHTNGRRDSIDRGPEKAREG